MRGTFIVAVFTVLALQGCGSAEVYDAINENRRDACRRVPPAEYEDCMERYSEPYEDYKRKRDEVVGQ